MKLRNPGKSTSSIEILQISLHGFWLLVDNTEYFLPFEKFPWFKEATVAQLHDVRFLHGFHLHWPKLDIDLELQSLEKLEKYPLVYK